jgi:hypothetical protein
MRLSRRTDPLFERVIDRFEPIHPAIVGAGMGATPDGHGLALAHLG